MSEHRFTDETATIAVLNTLVNDMHHALGRIISACVMVSGVACLLALIDLATHRWFEAALGLVASASFAVAAWNTRRRRRCYHPRQAKP